MKRWIGLVLALLLGLCPLSAAATKPTESPVPEIGAEPVILDGRHFDTCAVSTVIHLDGTLDRTFTFSNSLKRERAMRALFGDGLEDILDRLVAPVGGTFRSYDTFIYGEDGVILEDVEKITSLTPAAFYIFSLENASPEQILAFTNAVMETSDNEFSLSIAPHPTYPGCISVTLGECFDTVYRLDEEMQIHSTVKIDAVWRPGGGQDVYIESVPLFNLALHSGEATAGTGVYMVPFDQVGVSVGAESPRQGEVTLTFSPVKNMAPALADAVLAGLRQAGEAVAALRQEAGEILLTFSGTPEEISRGLNAFVGAYAGEGAVCPGIVTYYGIYDGIDDRDAVDIWIEIASSSSSIATVAFDSQVGEAAFTLSPLETTDRFKTGWQGELTLDLRPVAGKTRVALTGAGDVQLIPREALQSDMGLVFDTRLSTGFAVSRDTLAPLPLIIAGALLLAAGAAVLVWRFRDIRRLFVRRPAPAAAPAEQPEQPEEEPVAFEIPDIYIADGEEPDSFTVPEIRIVDGEGDPL